MGYTSRKTVMTLEGNPMPVSITGVQDTAPTANNFCVEHAEPVAVTMTKACPQCGNDNKDPDKKWRLGVKQGKHGAPIWVPDEVRATKEADHSISVVTAHDWNEVSALSMTVGTVYVVEAQKGSETLYENLRAWIQANPKVALCLTWGWTANKTRIWVLDVSMDLILMREMAHPADVRKFTPLTGTGSPKMQKMLDIFFEPEPFDMDTYEDSNAVLKAAVQAAPRITVETNEEALMASLEAAAAKKKAKKATTRKKAA